MTNEKQNPRDKVVDSLIEKLENNPGVWQKTWKTLVTNRPYNPISGTNYRGVNLLNLALTSQIAFGGDPRWATYNQAKQAGYPVRAGSKSLAAAIFHKVALQIEMPDGNSIPIKSTNKEGQVKEIKNLVQNRLPGVYEQIKNINDLSELTNKLNSGGQFKLWYKVIITSAPLFNFAQLENVPEIEIKEAKKEWADFERAENLLTATNYTIIHDQINKNFYSPGKNEIHLTAKAAFLSPEGYYSTAFHECSHAKLHDGTIPLDYNQSNYGINKTVRAKEELRAEISSVLICAELGMNYDVQNHASYINSWITLLKNDKTELWNAVADSNKVVDAIISYEKQMELESSTREQLITPQLSPENSEQINTNLGELEEDTEKPYQLEI